MSIPISQFIPPPRLSHFKVQLREHRRGKQRIPGRGVQRRGLLRATRVPSSRCTREWPRHSLAQSELLPNGWKPKVGEEGRKEPLRPQQCHPEAPVYLHDVVAKLPTARPVPRISHPGLGAPPLPTSSSPCGTDYKKMSRYQARPALLQLAFAKYETS